MVKRTIVLKSIDSKIFDIEYHIIELAKKMATGESIIIDLNMEGPCAASIKLFDLLDNLCEQFEYPKNKITIYTGNLLENSTDYKIILYSGRRFGFYDQVRSSLKPIDVTKNFDHTFKHFGSFVSRVNWQRLWITSKLFSKFKDKSLLTFHYDKTNDYHLSSSLGIETILNYHIQEGNDDIIDDLLLLLNHSPIKLENKEEVYPILVPENLDLAPFYKNFFVEIVYETYFSGKTFFPTEKIFRPIAYKTPFIVQGPRDFLTNMKTRGFKTFDKWWSEMYQDFTKLPVDCELQWSTFEILKLIDSISQHNILTLEEIYNDMKPTLEHNYELLVNGK